MAAAPTREDNIYFAKLAEQAERYEDMVKRMQNVVDVRSLPLISSTAMSSITKRETCYQLPTRTRLALEELPGDPSRLLRPRRRNAILATTTSSQSTDSR